MEACGGLLERKPAALAVIVHYSHQNGGIIGGCAFGFIHQASLIRPVGVNSLYLFHTTTV